MNRNIFCLLLLIPFASSSQSVSPGVINVSGGSASSTYFRLDWSVGELCLVDSYNKINCILENGFLHPGTERPGGNTNNFFAKGDILIFPNPAYTTTELNVTVQQAGTINLSMRDVMGKLLYSRQVTYNGVGLIEKLDVQRFPAGTYFVHLLLTPTDPAQPQRKGIFKITHLTY